MRMTIHALGRNKSDNSLLTRKEPVLERYSNTFAEKVPEYFDYSVEEILTQVEFDLPVKKEEKDKLDNERVMIKTLLGNIEKNRMKWRKEIFDSDTLSLNRKMAMQSVKGKID